jgi:hypothetical protein
MADSSFLRKFFLLSSKSLFSSFHHNTVDKESKGGIAFWRGGDRGARPFLQEHKVKYSKMQSGSEVFSSWIRAVFWWEAIVKGEQLVYNKDIDANWYGSACIPAAAEGRRKF